MGKFLRKHKEILLIGTLIFFALTIFGGIGMVFFTNTDTRELVAKVGPHKIKMQPFQANVRQTLEAMRQRDPKLEVTTEMEQALKNDILREMIIRTLFNGEARKWGVEVSPGEVSADVVQRPMFHNKEGQFDPSLYYQFVVRTLNMLPRDFEKERAEDLLSLKFRAMLLGSLTSTEPELKWLWSSENPGKGEKEWEKAKAGYAERVYQEKMVGLLNQLLTQLSQKNPVQTFL